MGGYDGRRGWIYHLAVLPNSHKRGLGTQYVDKLKELLRRKGCRKVSLLIEAENAAIQEFLPAIGL